MLFQQILFTLKRLMFDRMPDDGELEAPLYHPDVIEQIQLNDLNLQHELQVVTF
jgi:hypothetical protein